MPDSMSALGFSTLTSESLPSFRTFILGCAGVHQGITRPVEGEGDPRAARQDRPAGHDGGLPKKKL